MPAPLIAIIVVTIASYFLKPNVQLVHDLAEIRLTFPKISVYTELLNLHALLFYLYINHVYYFRSTNKSYK